MVKQEKLDTVFKALSHHVRRDILVALSSGEKTVEELSKPYQISQPAISKHLNSLEKAGLIERNRGGRYVYCTLEPKSLEAVSEWILQHAVFWSSQFNSLDNYLKAKRK